jgi:hypothetical protein
MIEKNEPYWKFKLKWKQTYKWNWSIYGSVAFAENVKLWWNETKLSNSFVSIKDGHVLIGTNDIADALQIKMAYGGKIDNICWKK